MNISLVHLLLIRHLREEKYRRSGPKSPSLRGIPKSHRCENTGSPGADVYVGRSQLFSSLPTTPHSLSLFRLRRLLSSHGQVESSTLFTLHRRRLIIKSAGA